MIIAVKEREGRSMKKHDKWYEDLRKTEPDFTKRLIEAMKEEMGWNYAMTVVKLCSDNERQFERYLR